MSNEMNKQDENKKRKVPLWLVVILPFILVMALSSLGIYAYQQQKEKPQISVLAAQLEVQKQQLLQQNDVINTNWLHTLNPLVKNVRGQLLWSSTKQKGLLEFSNLPSLPDDQKFQLWVYDLESTNNKPISATMGTAIPQERSNTLLIPFTAIKHVQKPFKFELLLKEEGKDDAQPLLLAQP